MDGKSVSAATRLVEARDGWAPVQWSPRAARMPPAIAALPTLTRTSRSAFFAGKADPKFGHEPEGDDPERFRKNSALHPFAGGAGPRLFLKPDLGSSRELSKPLLDALRADDERVVAVVVNAIDDQLKGSDQVALDYEDPQRIPVLARLFQVARETERAVLLISDHGHVPSQVLTGTRSDATDNGQRWRALAPGQSAQDGEIELPEGCWKPRGASGVAVFWDERRCWGSSRFGAHGGLALAEAVVPIRLLAPDWLHGVVQPPDDGLRTPDHQEQPAWWRLQPPPGRATRPPPAQAPLFPSHAPPPPRAPDPPTDEAPRRGALTAALAATDLFRARTDGVRADEVERALLYVDVLAAAGGAMPREAFARAVGVKLHRLPGRIAQLGSVNADGYTLIEHDLAADQVRLHLDRLKVQYGVS